MKLTACTTSEEIRRSTIAELTDGLERGGFDVSGLHLKADFVAAAEAARDQLARQVADLKKAEEEARQATLEQERAAGRHEAVLGPALRAVARVMERYQKSATEFTQDVVKARTDPAKLIWVVRRDAEDLFLDAAMHKELFNLATTLRVNMEEKDVPVDMVRETVKQLAKENLHTLTSGCDFEHRSTAEIVSIEGRAKHKAAQKMYSVYRSLLQSWGDDQIALMDITW